jgi:acyl-CoA synthetase (NDP forming)
MNIGDALLRPRVIAIVGASDDPTKTSSRPLRFLLDSGFAGRLMPVNRQRETVLGVPAYRSIEALPESPDHAFILAPTEGVLDAVAACVARRVPLVTVLAGGFGEGGSGDNARRAALMAQLRGSGTRLLGPNSIGVVNARNGLVLTANSAFAEMGMPVGKLFVASHSGSMIGALVSRGKAKGIGFAGLVSTGAELDLSLGEICEATLDDADIDAYALFLESLSHADAIRRFAHGAARRGKPVVAYKLGRSAQAAELTQSHTGAIAGADGIADAFLRDCGIARVETLDGLMEAPALLRRLVPRAVEAARPAVAVVTTTGGGAAMVVDQLGIRGVDVLAPSPETARRLAVRGIAAPPGRILDLTLAGTRPDIMSAALAVLLEAPEFDLVVVVAGSSARLQPELLIPAIINAGRAEKPLAAFITPDAPRSMAMLVAGGIPCFQSPEACGDSIAAAFARRPARPPLPARVPGARTTLDEAAGYSVLARLGLAAARHRVILPTATTSPLPYPVVLKLLSATVLHKSDIGGVELGIHDDVGFRAAAARIGANAAALEPPILVDRLLVQSMARLIGEVLLSYRWDEAAGPVVMLAAGGVLAEIHADHSLRLAPVNLATARSMIAEVKSLQALAGYRGRPRGDLDALADAIVSISRAGPDVAEAEINPLLVLPEGDGVVAVDAVVQLFESHALVEQTKAMDHVCKPADTLARSALPDAPG